MGRHFSVNLFPMAEVREHCYSYFIRNITAYLQRTAYSLAIDYMILELRWASRKRGGRELFMTATNDRGILRKAREERSERRHTGKVITIPDRILDLERVRKYRAVIWSITFPLSLEYFSVHIFFSRWLINRHYGLVTVPRTEVFSSLAPECVILAWSASSISKANRVSSASEICSFLLSQTLFVSVVCTVYALFHLSHSHSHFHSLILSLSLLLYCISLKKNLFTRLISSIFAIKW